MGKHLQPFQQEWAYKAELELKSGSQMRGLGKCMNRENEEKKVFQETILR